MIQQPKHVLLFSMSAFTKLEIVSLAPNGSEPKVQLTLSTLEATDEQWLWREKFLTQDLIEVLMDLEKTPELPDDVSVAERRVRSTNGSEYVLTYRDDYRSVDIAIPGAQPEDLNDLSWEGSFSSPLLRHVLLRMK